MSDPPPEEDDVLRPIVEEVKRHWRSSPYYDEAEGDMELQWREIIWPAIRSCDFRAVLELAPGHGRNSARLLELADELHLVDVNETCIERCRERFRGHAGPCRLRFHVNDGSSLPMLADDSVTLVYCWDAMVHFAPPLVRRYLAEFRRVLRPGGHAALHYSNYGAHADAPGNWLDNPHWRSPMTRELFNAYAAELGFERVAERPLEWDGLPELDYAAVLRKPA